MAASSKSTATVSSVVSADVTDIDSMSVHEPSTAAHCHRLRPDSPHPNPHPVSIPSLSAAADVDGCVAADENNAAVGSLETPNKMNLLTEPAAEAEDMSVDSDMDTDCQSEVNVDAVNRTFTLTSPSANTDLHAVVNDQTCVTQLRKPPDSVSDSPSSQPPGIHCHDVIIITLMTSSL